MGKTYSTLQAAKLIGVPLITLHGWLMARRFVLEELKVRCRV